MRSILTAVVVVAVVIGLAAIGATRALGAHPFWEIKIAAIGAPIGALIALIIGYFLDRRGMAAITSAMLAAAAFTAATLGKARFAASFAEDRIAGKFWYYGWIATALFLTLAVTLLVLRRRA